MAAKQLIERIPKERRAEFAEKFLQRYLEPAFGTSSKAETDLLVFSLLHEVGAIASTRSQYEIARDLRITPMRVRSLKMQMELRDTTQTEDSLRARIVEALSRLRYAKDGDLIQFGIEDPLLREDIAARVKKLGATADSSFNRELVRIQIDAFVDFITDLMPEDRRELVRKALIKAGMKDTSLEGLLVDALRTLGKKAAGELGDEIAKQAAELAGPAIKDLLSSAGGIVTSTWKRVFQLGSGSSSAAAGKQSAAS